MAEEYERFEITDYDLDNEFNPNRSRRRLTKNQQTYGIFAEDSDDDDEEPELRGSRGRKGKKADYSSKIDFISGGVQQSGKKKEGEAKSTDAVKKEEESDEDDEQAHKGFGFGKHKDSSESDEEDVRPSFKPQQTAGMRQATGSLSTKGLGHWEQHTKGIGAKLLLQMGYQPGKGLGKDLQGISAPVEAHVRKGRGAIGAYGPEKKTKVPELKQAGNKKPTDGEKEGEKADDKKQWTKKGHKKRYFYKSVEDVIEKSKKPEYMLYDSTSKLSKVTVIDMTGPEKRVLSGYHALGQIKAGDGESYVDTKRPPSELKYFQLPELMHNLDLVAKMCEQDIIANENRRINADSRQRTLQSEKEHLEKIVKLEKRYIETLEDVEELVEQLVATDNPPTLDEAEKLFVRLKVDFPNEFREFSLQDLAPGVIAPLISCALKDWSPLLEPTKNVGVVRRWADLLDFSKSATTTLFDPFPALVWSCVIPYFRKAATEDWNPKNHTQMAALLDAWSALLPDWMLDNVLEQIVLGRLTQTVAEWDPLTDIVPIHTWILPWSSLLGHKMHENVFRTICEKLSRAFRAWHPQDRSALAMIRPWKGVFRDEDLQMFLHKNVVPKLELRMNEIVFNPLQQDLEIFSQVWEWHELLTPLVMANLLDKYFFPKWMQTLLLWLNQAPNFDEVTRWYSGWKALLSEPVLKQANVSEHFRRALEIMQRAAGITVTKSEPAMPTQSLHELNLRAPSTMNLDYKEIVSQQCAERGIIFAPMPGRRENGKQVYRIGKLFCFFEKSVCCVSADPGSNSWMPMSLSVILEKAK